MSKDKYTKFHSNWPIHIKIIKIFPSRFSVSFLYTMAYENDTFFVSLQKEFGRSYVFYQHKPRLCFFITWKLSHVLFHHVFRRKNFQKFKFRNLLIQRYLPQLFLTFGFSRKWWYTPLTVVIIHSMKIFSIRCVQHLISFLKIFSSVSHVFIPKTGTGNINWDPCNIPL